MNDILMQSQAEATVLEFKLDRIRKRIEDRIGIVDPITKVELQVLLSMIAEYETIPAGWSLERPLVPANDEEVSE